MAAQFSSKEYGLFTQILRRGVALGLCTTLLPFAQLDLFAQNAPPPQQSQYPYQDPGGDPAAQQQNGQQGPPPQYGEQQNGETQDGNGPAGPPPGYGQQGAYPEQGQGGYDQSAPQAYQPQGPQQLEQLVAPIALYPDSLVAQVLAASTYPQQVQEANGWMQQYGNQPPEQLAQSANAMPWDPSVKALTQFPSVLQQLAHSSQWTIALGNAYYNQPADVMAAVQSMRYRAREAGQLRDTPQQVVVDEGPEIVIQPANPEVVYVPYYDPWVCYGAPISPYYGWYRPAPPIGFALGVGIGIGFGVGVGIAAFGHWGWGYHAWAPNWHSNTIIVNNNTYISRSTTVINHGGYGAYNQGFGRGGPQNFAHASFNPHAALYNGRPMSAANRPPVNNAGFNRPGGNTLARPNQPGNFNRPGANTGAYNRPAAPNAGAFNRPATGTSSYGRPSYSSPSNGGYNRPAAPNGSYNRPAAPGGAYNRPAPSANYGGSARPQAAPRASAPSHPAAPRAQHEGGGGGEHHGGGEHKN
jgi:hypothetical protein